MAGPEAQAADGTAVDGGGAKPREPQADGERAGEGPTGAAGGDAVHDEVHAVDGTAAAGGGAVPRHVQAVDGGDGPAGAAQAQAVDGAAVDRGGAAVELRGLTRNYGERAALAGLTLTLAAGDTLVVFGPNGAGKTTLLRVLATLLRPHGGDAIVLGARLPSEAWRVRGRVGLLGHESLLYRELTARENLRYHASLHGVAFERVEELLGQLRLHRRADEPLRTLSRGTVQRVAVARAVLHDPDLLLLDEPYANLDPAAIELVEPLIARMSDPTRPRTRVLTSHDPARGLAEAGTVLGLRGGQTALLGAASDIDPAQVAELYR